MFVHSTCRGIGQTAAANKGKRPGEEQTPGSERGVPEDCAEALEGQRVTTDVPELC